MPKLLSSPVRGHPVDADLVYTFDAPIKLGAGTITFESEHGVVYSGPIADNPYLTVSGNTLVFNPPAALAYVTMHWIEFSAGAITDLPTRRISAEDDGRSARQAG